MRPRTSELNSAPRKTSSQRWNQWNQNSPWQACGLPARAAIILAALVRGKSASAPDGFFSAYKVLINTEILLVLFWRVCHRSSHREPSRVRLLSESEHPRTPSLGYLLCSVCETCSSHSESGNKHQASSVVQPSAIRGWNLPILTDSSGGPQFFARDTSWVLDWCNVDIPCRLYGSSTPWLWALEVAGWHSCIQEFGESSDPLIPGIPTYEEQFRLCTQEFSTRSYKLIVVSFFEQRPSSSCLRPIPCTSPGPFFEKQIGGQVGTVMPCVHPLTREFVCHRDGCLAFYVV